MPFLANLCIPLSAKGVGAGEDDNFASGAMQSEDIAFWNLKTYDEVN
jgi:hypothetical protein